MVVAYGSPSFHYFMQRRRGRSSSPRENSSTFIFSSIHHLTLIAPVTKKRLSNWMDVAHATHGYPGPLYIVLQLWETGSLLWSGESAQLPSSHETILVQKVIFRTIYGNVA
uniref:Uncharacterized protein n=1 Tax=Odontella aurita TaxID=265563 RepID=A0A7S4K3Z5_9STRA